MPPGPPSAARIIRRLPDGYHTRIGENGSTLSGGERQRLSIARALLKDAPVILMDEATASLDVENETLVQEAISNLVKDKTVLIIAHRMRTVAGADRIVVLKDGLVAGAGDSEGADGQERGLPPYGGASGQEPDVEPLVYRDGQCAVETAAHCPLVCGIS